MIASIEGKTNGVVLLAVMWLQYIKLPFSRGYIVIDNHFNIMALCTTIIVEIIKKILPAQC